MILKLLLETIPDLVWLKNPDGVYLECNRSFQDFFGKTRDEIIGHTDYDICDRKIADFFRKKDSEAMIAGCSQTNEETVFDVSKKKTTVLETIKTPMRGINGDVLGILGVARDITERKKYEEVIQHRLELVTARRDSAEGVELDDFIDLKDLQELQDRFANAFSVASMITKQDGTPITKPSNFCQFCRIVRETKVGRLNCKKSDSKLGGFNPTGANVSPCLSGGLWDAGVPIIIGKRQIASWLIGQVRDETQKEPDIIAYADEIGVDREELLTAFRKVPVLSEKQFKNIANVLHTFADQLANTAYQNLMQARYISESKQYEENILRMNKELKSTSEALEESNRELEIAVCRAEESDRLKSAFLANMSHEIRTPLNAILGFSSLLGDPNYTQKESDEFVRLINKSGESLLDLINNIIDISKLDAGLTVLDPKPTKLLNLIKDVFEIFRGKVDENVSLLLTLPPEELEVLCDQTRLRQVLNNLLQNAMKFTSEGVIELGVKEIGKEQDHFLFWVRDSGIGIEPKNHDAIFERFRQASDETEKLYGGTGLGLSITKSCVEMMGGKIWVESELGKGATFFFELPLKIHNKENPKSEMSEKSPYAFNGQHILIAEDDPTNFAYLKTILKGMDLRISHTVTGCDTIRMVKNHDDISVVLMDIRMPDGDGLYATREIRRDNPDIPIIAQTAYAFSTDQEECLDAGCNEYLTKPTKREEVLNLLRRYIFDVSKPEAM